MVFILLNLCNDKSRKRLILTGSGPYLALSVRLPLCPIRGRSEERRDAPLPPSASRRSYPGLRAFEAPRPRARPVGVADVERRACRQESAPAISARVVSRPSLRAASALAIGWPARRERESGAVAPAVPGWRRALVEWQQAAPGRQASVAALAGQTAAPDAPWSLPVLWRGPAVRPEARAEVLFSVVYPVAAPVAPHGSWVAARSAS
jgi:hypothetical protein